MGTVYHHTTVNTMKIAAIISALVAVGLAEEAKVLTTPLAYAGYPYAGLGYAGAYGHAGLGYAGAYGHAGLPYAAAGYAGYPYAAATVAAPAPVVAAAPAVTYAAAPAYAAAPVAAPAVAYAAAAPVIAAAPYTAGSQFHAQDEFGNLNYGYANINSVKQEVGNTYGGVTGGYSYVDANGELQQVQYIADGAGFRVADSRLPVAPVYDGVAPTFNPVLPVAPVDTPEVAEAKAAHLAAVAAAAAPAERKRREADPAFAYGFGTAHPTYAYGYAGLPYAAGLPHAAAYGYAGLGYGLPYYG